MESVKDKSIFKYVMSNKVRFTIAGVTALGFGVVGCGAASQYERAVTTPTPGITSTVPESQAYTPTAVGTRTPRPTSTRMPTLTPQPIDTRTAEQRAFLRQISSPTPIPQEIPHSCPWNEDGTPVDRNGNPTENVVTAIEECDKLSSRDKVILELTDVPADQKGALGDVKATMTALTDDGWSTGPQTYSTAEAIKTEVAGYSNYSESGYSTPTYTPRQKTAVAWPTPAYRKPTNTPSLTYTPWDTPTPIETHVRVSTSTPSVRSYNSFKQEDYTTPWDRLSKAAGRAIAFLR